MLPELNSFHDLLDKLEYDKNRFATTSHIYELLDCLLTLNALPEWIINSEIENDKLKELAREKILIMRGINFDLDENLISQELNHQLRLIRLVCNHAKHKTNSKLIPKIEREYDASFPMDFPVKFGFVISVGNKKVDAEFILDTIAKFWKTAIAVQR